MIMRRPKFPSFGGVASGRGGCWLYGYTQIYTDTPVSTNYLLLLLGVFTYYNDHPALRAPLRGRGITAAQHLINSLSFCIFNAASSLSYDVLNSPPLEGWPAAGVVIFQRSYCLRIVKKLFKRLKQALYAA